MRGSTSKGAAIQSGLKLLRDRYVLVENRLDLSGDSETWVGAGEDEKLFLVRLWPYSGDNPPDLLRALWDAELRTLYRVASAPGADESILVIRDAGLDRTAACFVMVLEAEHSGGYEPLSNALTSRTQFSWLHTSKVDVRRDLWKAMLNIARGVSLLHGQNILHRNIQAKRVYFNPLTGVDSLRLGGFEWSVRVGIPAAGRPPSVWSSPPEFFRDRSFGYRPETDWYAFGMLAARCFRPLEKFEDADPIKRHQKILLEIDRASVNDLTEIEKDFLIRLIAEDSDDRLCDAESIPTALGEIIEGLTTDCYQASDDAPLVLATNPSSAQTLVENMMGLGFVPNPDSPTDHFNPHDTIQVRRFLRFIQEDLDAAEPGPRLSSVHNREFYLLEGQNLILMLSQFTRTDRNSLRRENTWNLAFCAGPAELRGKEASVELVGHRISVRSLGDVLRDYPLQGVKSWQKYLPLLTPSAQMQAGLSKFLNYIRCSNQIELLIRDAEIFAYEIVGEPKRSPAKIEIVIREIAREKTVLSTFEIDGGLAEFLLREIGSLKAESRTVVLTDSDSLHLQGGAREWRTNAWYVETINPNTRTISLSQVIEKEIVQEPLSSGYVRAWGMFGQVPLLQRRKRAIDRLQNHSFLLRSLYAPSQVYMDTGFGEMPVTIPTEIVDSAKQAAIEDILRIRPIYTLQGPPGTGKTTLVAHLLRQIFEEDPVAQVLITAQAHGAVDVLRSKVRNEAFRDVSEENLPLSVRIGMDRKDGGESELDGSVRQVAIELLRSAGERLDDIEERSEIQDSWLGAIHEMLTGWENRNFSGIDDFFEAVKRGASITYCTTNAGDLEALADSVQSFDWTIVEEAGKAYAFDLALPLQMGHRWLLIGDHLQLPPYRFEDHEKAIVSLDEVVHALRNLPSLHHSLVDLDWLKSWAEMEPPEQEEFKRYVLLWLNAFKQFFQQCSRSSGSQKLTAGTSMGAAAGKLIEQHRMHPTIGELISTVFYDGDLISRTEVDGTPIPRVTHPFSEPRGVLGKSIVWVNTEWSARDARLHESGREQNEAPYSNYMEADSVLNFIERLRTEDTDTASGGIESFEIVALSPYARQVALLNRLYDPNKLAPRLSTISGLTRGPRRAVLAHTVDSFQGNQADVVCVSLVRNNRSPAGEGLGFLGERARLNVLLSRAKRLLVLFGSWDFFEFQVKDVFDSSQRFWHWKQVMTKLEEDFHNGTALKIEATFSEP